MNWYFLFFFISGFCSILYEIVWRRLAMTQFGVTTALVSIVLSMFMAGLGLGSWASAWLLRLYAADPDAPAMAADFSWTLWWPGTGIPNLFDFSSDSILTFRLWARETS